MNTIKCNAIGANPKLVNDLCLILGLYNGHHQNNRAFLFLVDTWFNALPNLLLSALSQHTSPHTQPQPSNFLVNYSQSPLRFTLSSNDIDA